MSISCPQCQQPGVPVATAAQDVQLNDALRATLAAPPLPVRRTAGGLGCATLALSFAVSVFVSVLVGGVAELTNGTNFPAQGMRLGETGVFTGIATFIVVMVALFSLFVWRQARMDTHYKAQFSQWHRQKTAYDAEYYCARCNTRWDATPATHTT